MNDDRNITSNSAKGGGVKMLIAVPALMAAAGFVGWFAAKQTVVPQQEVGGEQQSEPQNTTSEGTADPVARKSDPPKAQEIERYRKFEGKYWLELAKSQSREGNHFTAAMMAGKSVGFVGLGLEREGKEHPALLKPEHGQAHEEAIKLAKQQWLKSPELVWRTSHSSHHGRRKIELAYSPDGNLLATLGEKSFEIRLWNTKTGDALSHSIHTGKMNGSLRYAVDGNKYIYHASGLSFSPDGKYLAYRHKAQGEVHFHNLDLGETEVARFPGFIDQALGAEFHPNQPCMLIHDGDAIVFWDYLKSERLGEVHQVPVGGISSAYFDREGKRVVVCNLVKNAEVWNYKDGRLSDRIEIDPTKVESAEVHVRKPQKYDKVHERWVPLPKSESDGMAGWASPRHCFFPQDGIMATQFLAHPWIDVWDLNTGEVMDKSYPAKPWFPRAVAINKAGNLWVGVARGREISSRLLMHRTDDDREDFEAIANAVPQISDFEFSPDGKRLAMGSIDGVIRFLDMKSRDWVVDMPEEETKGELKEIRFSKDGSSLVAHFRNSAWTLDPATGNYLEKLDSSGRQGGSPADDPAEDPFRSDGLEVALPDGSVILAASDKSSEVFFRDAATLKQIGEPMVTGEFTVAGENTMGVVAMALSPDGKHLSVGHRNHSVSIWDVEQRIRLGELMRIHTSPLADLEFSPDGRFLVVGAKDGIISLWYLKHLTTDLVNEGLTIRPLFAGQDGAKVLTVSEDLKLLASTDKKNMEVQLWNLQTGCKIGVPFARQENEKVICGLFYLNDKYLAVGIGRNIDYWDVTTGLRWGAGPESDAAIAGIALGDQDRFMVYWSGDKFRARDLRKDGKIRTWDLACKDCDHNHEVISAAINPQGRDAVIAQYGLANFMWCPDLVEKGRFDSIRHNKLMRPYRLEFSGDGKVLMATYGSHPWQHPENYYLRKIHRYDAKTMEPIGDEIWTDGHCILHSTISPNHAWIATSSCDGKLRIWDTKSGDLLACHMVGFTGALKFASDSRKLIALVGGRVDPEAGLDEDGICKDFKSWNGCVERIVECDLRALKLDSPMESSDLAHHVVSGNFLLTEAGLIPKSPTRTNLYKDGNERGSIGLPEDTMLKASPKGLRKVMGLLRQAQNWKAFIDLYLERGDELKENERFDVVQFLIALAGMEASKPSSAHADYIFGLLDRLIPEEMVKAGKLDLALLGLCRDVVKIEDKKRGDAYWKNLLAILMYMEKEARDRCLAVIEEAEAKN